MGKKSGGNEAEKARKDEQLRQDRIRAGTNNVNAIFDGGAYKNVLTPTGGALDFDKGEYYDAQGKRLTGKITSFNNELVFGKPETRTASFGDDYFDKQQTNFLNYANPQLEDQRSGASKELSFALSRAGLLNSSVRAQKEGDLQKTYDLNKQQIADQALSYKSEAKNKVEDARANLIATLNATGDAQGATSSAIARASALSAPAAYSPISNLFADFTSALGTQAALEKANTYGPGGTQVSRYNSGLFGNSRSVVNKP